MTVDDGPVYYVDGDYGYHWSESCAQKHSSTNTITAVRVKKVWHRDIEPCEECNPVPKLEWLL